MIGIVISMMTEADFWDKFHAKHNPGHYYAKKKIEKEIKEKNQKQEDDPTKFKIFRK